MKFAYYLVFALWYLLSLLPLRVLYFFSDFLYIPLYYGARYRRNIVRKNLVGSFPEKSQEEIIRIEKKFYHSFVIIWWKPLSCFPCRRNRLCVG